MLQQFPATLLRLSPRVTLSGDPGSSLQGINTTILADGALCWVSSEQSDYRFSRSVPIGFTPDVAPSAGPGGWFRSSPVDLSYGSRAFMGFAEVSTSGNAPTLAKSFDTTGLADSNYMATAQFSAKGGGVAMLTRRRPFQVVGGVLSAIDAIEEIGTDVGADVASVAVDIAVNAASIDFNVTGIAATNLDWVVEWGVSRY